MHRTFRALFVFFALGAFATVSAQSFGVGLKLGTTLNDAISSASAFPNVATQPLIAGPYVEFRLPFSFSMEIDALHESSVLSNAVSGGANWQFPVLAKYKLLKGPLRPYVEGGVAFSHITDLKNLPELNHSSNYGIVLGAGLELKLLLLRVSPEVRYNGWAFKNIVSPTGAFESNRNQAMFLVGVGF
jgi:opacity protein-like surface antigen